ncbi:retropepsin-like aspartic protease [Pedobacter sp. JY14-1]|uniref:retropepsin-like aspartic protease n=1 Tax=Pedobacter sp. JY14-1 TaxID=3034151 RepID=UPI0023E350AE|nr:retropepsin-like aspartic protease [Pedobacter sp. JY14-1]
MRTITVPLTLISLEDDGFHLLADIVIFGLRLYAVVDTGASRSVFDKSLLQGHLPGLDHREGDLATTLFTTSGTIQAVLPELRIGRLCIRDYDAVALDLESVNNTYKGFGHPPIAGIIGSDLLLRYHAVIDYKKTRLFLHEDLP